MSLNIILILILLFAFIGLPLFVVMAFSGMALFLYSGGEISAVASEIYRMAQAPTLVTIPLFTFAGYLMANSRSPQRLMKVAEAGLSWLPGGISIVTLLVCTFFTAFTGASGSLGLLFPISLPMIFYGLVAKVDIDKLFKAGIVPGFVIIFILSFWSILNTPKKAMRKKFIARDFASSLKEAGLELILPILVLLGIYGGFVTVTEAATLTAFYVFILEVFIYKDLSLIKDIPRISIETMTLVSAILLVLACALGFTNYLVDEDVPSKLFATMRVYLTNKYAFLFFLNIFLLIVGSLMDIFSAIVVVVPLIIPIAHDFGVDPVHLAVIFLTNLEIGYLHPPVGINLFIASNRFKKPITQLYWASIPFVILLLIALFILTYFPILTLGHNA